MKKSVKILIAVLLVIFTIFFIFAKIILKNATGSEEITGNQGEIPQKIIEIPSLTKSDYDWPNWRGPHFDGISHYKGIKTDWTNGLNKIWEIDFLCQGQTTASWASVVIQGNRLIVPGRDEKNDLVFCLNAENGNLIWKGSYPAEAGTSHGPGPRATPFIDNDRVYTFGRSGDLVCWYLLDGKIIWHKNVKDEGGEEPDWGLSSTPLVIDNKVVVQGGGKTLVIAYEKMTGEILWKSLEGPSGYAATIPLNIDSTKVLLVYHAKALSCLDLKNGHEKWRAPWETQYGVNASTPVVYKDIIFHTSGYEQGGQVLKVTRYGCKVLWTTKSFAAQHSDPFIIDGGIYGYSGQSTSNKGEFKCLELETGKELWSTSEIGNGTATCVDGYIICLDLKGNLFLIKPEKSGFKKIAEIKQAISDVKNLSWTVPVFANGKLYLRYMQKLICYDLRK